jgi:hypothetical protein
MAKEPRNYILLKLWSCDNLDNVTFTSTGTSGEKPSIRLHVTLPIYDLGVEANLKCLSKVNLSIEGVERRFAVVAIEPAPEATSATLKAWKVNPPKPEPQEAPVQDWVLQMPGLFQEIMFGRLSFSDASAQATTILPEA